MHKLPHGTDWLPREHAAFLTRAGEGTSRVSGAVLGDDRPCRGRRRCLLQQRGGPYSKFPALKAPHGRRNGCGVGRRADRQRSRPSPVGLMGRYGQRGDPRNRCPQRSFSHSRHREQSAATVRALRHSDHACTLSHAVSQTVYIRLTSRSIRAAVERGDWRTTCVDSLWL
jgi:hypothetical protein